MNSTILNTLDKMALNCLVEIKLRGMGFLPGSGICTNVKETLRNEIWASTQMCPDTAVETLAMLHREYVTCDTRGSASEYRLNALMMEWPKYSGCDAFPVPIPEDLIGKCLSPVDVYLSSKCLWEGSYGYLRLELVDFLIQRLKESITD